MSGREHDHRSAVAAKSHRRVTFSLRAEASSWPQLHALLVAGLAEFACTAAFVFLATGAVTSGCHTADTAAQSGGSSAELETVVPGACFLGSTNLLNIALAFGFALFVMVYAVASFLGGHLNPAITVAMLLAGRLSLLRAAVYIIAQCTGAMVGSAMVLAIDPLGHRAALGAANRLNSWANIGSGVGVETAIFVFVVFAAVDQARGANSAHLPVLAPLAIGVTAFVCHLVAVPLDGCSINPARSLGTAVVANNELAWKNHWIFWVGPLVGGSVAGLSYKLLAYKTPVFGGPVDEESKGLDGCRMGLLLEH